jgi:hypothetical protein
MEAACLGWGGEGIRNQRGQSEGACCGAGCVSILHSCITAKEGPAHILICGGGRVRQHRHYDAACACLPYLRHQPDCAHTIVW